MSAAIAIFVKTPGHSPIKTRLAADIGAPAAEDWYRRSVQATLAVVKQYVDAGCGPAFWAVAEEGALSDETWSSLPRIAQPEGGLGERMSAVYQCLLDEHGDVILIGADAPQLQAGELARAAKWLGAIDEERYALGTALDGGFWLFGGNRPLPLRTWTQVGYSQPDTAAQFRLSVGADRRWLDLGALRDVDAADDLPGVADALEALPDPLPEQRALARLSRELIARSRADA